MLTLIGNALQAARPGIVCRAAENPADALRAALELADGGPVLFVYEKLPLATDALAAVGARAWPDDRRTGTGGQDKKPITMGTGPTDAADAAEAAVASATAVVAGAAEAAEAAVADATAVVAGAAAAAITDAADAALVRPRLAPDRPVAAAAQAAQAQAARAQPTRATQPEPTQAQAAQAQPTQAGPPPARRSRPRRSPPRPLRHLQLRRLAATTLRLTTRQPTTACERALHRLPCHWQVLRLTHAHMGIRLSHGTSGDHDGRLQRDSRAFRRRRRGRASALAPPLVWSSPRRRSPSVTTASSRSVRPSSPVPGGRSLMVRSSPLSRAVRSYAVTSARTAPACCARRSSTSSAACNSS